jgi:chorismate dehydratase
MKIGKFGYINNYLPYYWIEKNRLADVVVASPKQMISMLEGKIIDYAPIPSFYYIKNKDRLKSYDFCISSNGRVYSVIVVSKRKTLSEKIAVTEETTTSVNLLRIILNERGLNCKLVLAKTHKTEELLRMCDCALVIGDEAIRARDNFNVVMDLGEEWKDLTGYPMVFGISASIDNAEHCDRLLMKSVDWGLKNFDEIVTSAVRESHISEDFLRVYFKALDYKMDSKKRRGLRIFEDFCSDLV